MDITQKTLDKNKFDFIICYNNDIYLQECMDYISFLNVPEGIEIDVISIAGAESMAAGYNAGMNSSTAKYKVYLHQDTFILNENFISEVIDIFENNPEYGLLGVFGHDKLEPDANYWDRWNIGTTLACNGLFSGELGKSSTELCEAYAVDGMIMITQYDIPWREDVFDGWDFYDVSQSTEFRKSGYKVGVVSQRSKWCLHDCGHSKLGNYNHYRKLFCEHYASLGYQYADNPVTDEYKNRTEKAATFYSGLCKLLEAGEIDGMKEVIDKLTAVFCLNTDVLYLTVLCNVISCEKTNNLTKRFCLIDTVDEMRKMVVLCKFLLWRIEYDKPFQVYSDLLEWLFSQKDDNLSVLKEFANVTALDKWKVCNVLTLLYANSQVGKED